jgi:hypothetical protein
MKTLRTFEIEPSELKCPSGCGPSESVTAPYSATGTAVATRLAPGTSKSKAEKWFAECLSAFDAVEVFC